MGVPQEKFEHAVTSAISDVDRAIEVAEGIRDSEGAWSLSWGFALTQLGTARDALRYVDRTYGANRLDGDA
jgi:hypothetical protein